MNDTDHRHTRSQRMAGVALTCVQEVSRENAMLRKDYDTRAMSFPAMVIQAGAAQALGFLRAKGGAGNGAKGNAYTRYLDDLARVLGKPGGEVLHKQVIDAPLPEYRVLTRDLLDASAWLRRFAQALLTSHDNAAEDSV
jgi:CRISPR-associated protein Cmr5